MDPTELTRKNGSAAVIGVFDSGVGGLSVLRAIHLELPGQPAIYFADQANVPYGMRPTNEVRAFSEEITRFLLDAGAELIVVACNTASAAALHHLREVFPSVVFVGMEPAVKPAAETTGSGVVGVLATPATFQGALYASVVERFAGGVRLIQDTCPGLVAEIEAGKIKSAEAREILNQALGPMLASGIDTVVLGCTHYPFIIPVIREIVGPQIRVIDPAPAIAKQVRRRLSAQDSIIAAHGAATSTELSTFTYYTSGDIEKFDWVASLLMKSPVVSRKVDWIEGRLCLPA